MDILVLKIVGIVCVTILGSMIVIFRKDDIDNWSVFWAVLLEIVALFIIFISGDNIADFIERIKLLF